MTALNPEVPEIQQHDFMVNTNFKVETTIDTFSISKVNRDPFLGTYLQKRPTKKNKPKKKTILWKPIAYNGIIKNGKNEMFIVTINNKQHLLKEGQIRDSIELVRGNDRAITMRYKNMSKSFTLKHKR